MLNFQGTVYIKLVLALCLTLLGGSILSVKPPLELGGGNGAPPSFCFLFPDSWDHLSN